MATQAVKRWIKSHFPGLIQFRKKSIAQAWPQKSIVFYMGKTREEVTPKLLKRRAGGSQIAVIHLAREIAKLGYQVVVYANCGVNEGLYDGVEYLNHYRCNKYDKFNIFVIWKYPQMLDAQIQAKQVWLDLHDEPKPKQEFTSEKLQKFDKILVKSQYHRHLFCDLPEHQFAVISNGVDGSLATLSKHLRDPYKLIYASRYYRGLELMLTYGWPIIRQEIPEAELHLYYGWTAPDNRPERADWKQKMIRLIDQPGVIDHGMVGHDQLLAEKATATIHYYACTFDEVDCISVRESAVVGCIPVTTDYAALSEKPYCVRISGDPSDRVVQENIAHKIAALPKNQEQLTQMRPEVQRLAQAENWHQAAKSWVALGEAATITC